MYSSRVYNARSNSDPPLPPERKELGESPRSFSNSSLRPPPYRVAVEDLTIIAPPATRRIPIIGVSLPDWSKSRQNPTEIIRSVNLDIEGVHALIGGSGSGKTTLLNAIAGRLGSLQMLGRVSFIPTAPSPRPTPLVLGYVRQEDTLLPYLSVRETLQFAAELRLPKSVSREDRLAIVEQVITELGLMDSVETFVGLLSGGQRRRVSIGCVLVTSCSVLVLDEPTTGLDSFTACRLLETLSNLAKNGGRTVVLSIHQPRSDAFSLFDQCTLLSTGSVVYSGATTSLIPHFERLGFHLEPHTNPLDFVIDISSVDTRTDESEATTSTRVNELVAAWKKVNISLAIPPVPYSSRIAPSSSRNGDAPSSLPLGEMAKGAFSSMKEESGSGSEIRSPFIGRNEERSHERPGWIGQTAILTRGSLQNVARNRGFLFGLAAQSIILGVALGLAFFDPPETPAGVQTFKTIIFQSTPAFFYLSIIIAVAVWTVELQVFDREREDGLYCAVPFVCASTLAFLPANIVFPMLYGTIIYFMTGFTRSNLAVNLLSFLAQCAMQQVSAYGYALLCASVSRSFAGASLLANGFAIPFILSAGYLVIELPIWISWTRWISPYFYGFRWIATLQLQDRTFACEGITGPTANACDGDAVLIGFAFPLGRSIYIYPLGLLGFVIVTHILATIVLHFYKPGGVKHAAKQSPPKNSLVGSDDGITKEQSRIPKHDQVQVQVNRLSLAVTQNSIRGRRTAEKIILQDVSCSFPAGEVSCIMGPSGAGKSSLLSVLARRSGGGLLSNFALAGEILLNGNPLDGESSGSIAFVAQDDSHHLPALTVRETLHYAASLRLRMPATQQIARAEAVIRMLGLKLCADNLVGGELLKGISGGEKRRLTLAEALLSDVSVLYADEPLSGLDAFSALNVMLTLKNLAASGITVVITVHQPRSEIWKLFDNVLLLAEGGRTVYSGRREGILEFFESNSAICPPNFNAADFILDQVSIDHRSPAAEYSSTEKVAHFVSSWDRTKSTTTSVESSSEYSPVVLSTEYAPMESRTKEVGVESPTKQAPNHESSGTKATKTATKHASAPFHIALPVLIGRSFKNLRRQQDAALARIINPPFLALLFFLFFGRLNLAASSAQTRVGILQETTALPFVGMLACLSIFPVERDLFLHEYKSASSRQSVSTFLLAYTLQEILVSIISSGLFSLVVVFGIGLQNSPRIFIEFWVSSFALINLGESIGIFFCAFVDNGGLAVSLVSVGITILSQLNGIISVTLPTWLEYLGWASPLKLQARIQIINEFTGLVFDCSQDQIASGACIAETGEQLLETFSITGGAGATAGYVAIIIGSIVVYRLLALIALHIRVAL